MNRSMWFVYGVPKDKKKLPALLGPIHDEEVLMAHARRILGDEFHLFAFDYLNDDGWEVGDRIVAKLSGEGMDRATINDYGHALVIYLRKAMALIFG